MRGIVFFLLAFYLSLAQEIQISQKLKTLNLLLPTQKGFTTHSTKDSLQIIVDDQLVQKDKTQSLSPPFEKIQILPLPSNQTQITIFGKNLTLIQNKIADKIHLEIHSETLRISWLNYFYGYIFIAVLILILLWLKRRLKHSKKPINYQEIFLSPKSKIISFEYEGVEYRIFCNEKGNVLLNHYPKTDHNKDFTHLISED